MCIRDRDHQGTIESFRWSLTMTRISRILTSGPILWLRQFRQQPVRVGALLLHLNLATSTPDFNSISHVWRTGIQSRDGTVCEIILVVEPQCKIFESLTQEAECSGKWSKIKEMEKLEQISAYSTESLYDRVAQLICMILYYLSTRLMLNL